MRLTVLQAAAYCGKSENVKLLIDHGAKLNTEPIGIYGNELQGTLHLPANHAQGSLTNCSHAAAVFTGDEDTIRILLTHGANTNAFGGLYSYAIIAAVSRGHSVATRILLNHNAHVNVRGGEDNWPVVSLAAATLQTEDLRLILKNVADINATCDKGTTALINCAEAGDSEGVKFLLANDADVSVISASLGSALHAAA
ncbi:MAG: ankyrin repeat domain-containing protein [Cytophagaceae bacterium]|nr:MAG: ankyrin repeat domain-containing protein [Cytophagaceae bacterium]